MDPTILTTVTDQTKQAVEETSREREARAQQNFPQVEGSLPDLPRRRSVSRIDSLTSYLGHLNPFSHPVQEDTETVWLFDNAAYRPEPFYTTRRQPWQVEIVSAYFVRSSGRDCSKEVAKIATIIGLDKGTGVDKEKAMKTIEDRLTPLLNTILPARTVEVKIGDAQSNILGPSGPNGISVDMVQIDKNYEHGDTISNTVPHLTSSIPGRTRFADPTGWAIISDIDDTIKKTLTDDPIGILRTTFVEEPEPIAGMPEFYKYLFQQFKQPPLWYLSASPYTLYQFLRQFRDAHYPPGTMTLRDASWMNLAGFLSSLTKGTQAYKVFEMEKIQRIFPRRSFVCLGDSTQSDPQAYAELYRLHPTWIKAIYIRKVQNIKEVTDVLPWRNQEKRNSKERFEKAFEGVPKEIFYVFDDPKELYDKVAQLIKAGLA